jgi:hypothetical protein
VVGPFAGGETQPAAAPLGKSQPGSMHTRENVHPRQRTPCPRRHVETPVR